MGFGGCIVNVFMLGFYVICWKCFNDWFWELNLNNFCCVDNKLMISLCFFEKSL